MKRLNFYLLILLVSVIFACESSTSQEKVLEEMEESADDIQAYNPEKAAEYGADDYGMKKYVMAFLKKGPNRDLDSTQAAVLQGAHMENIGKMAAAGQLVLAGPFFGDGDLRGIYIFNTPSIAEAEALTNSDPAIKAGSLEMELIEWYGSAALMGINEVHQTLAKPTTVEE